MEVPGEFNPNLRSKPIVHDLVTDGQERVLIKTLFHENTDLSTLIVDANFKNVDLLSPEDFWHNLILGAEGPVPVLKSVFLDRPSVVDMVVVAPDRRGASQARIPERRGIPIVILEMWNACDKQQVGSEDLPAHMRRLSFDEPKHQLASADVIVSLEEQVKSPRDFLRGIFTVLHVVRAEYVPGESAEQALEHPSPLGFWDEIRETKTK